VLEPGAGFGVLTRLLKRHAGRVIAVEKDPRLARNLQKTFAKSTTVEVIEGDVLKVPLSSFDRVVGTPPYYISSKLVLFLLESKFRKAHLVFQKEFGERLLAQPGTRDYGRLSVSTQRMLRVESLFSIPRTAFEPKPKIDSMLLALEPKIYRQDVDRHAFDELVRGVFNQRRRLLRSSLTHFLKLKIGLGKARELLKTIAIPDKRVYQLSVDELEEIAIQLKSVLNDTKTVNGNNIFRSKMSSRPVSRHADN
jgi:16S rRNA (adenine1518-N6/adenine1519-N6)-dimethyltransferase